MGTFPKQHFWPSPLVHITPYHSGSIADLSFGGTGPNSSAWAAANTAVFIPFRISTPYIFNTLFWVNAATVSGNVDMGVYSEDGTRIVSKGSTAQAGASAIQSVSVASTQIGPGVFYFAFVADNTTSTFYSIQSHAATLQAVGMAQVASAFPLPATVTLASITSTFMPEVGITGRSVI